MRMGLNFGVGFAGFNVATAKRNFLCFPEHEAEASRAEREVSALSERSLSRNASVSVSTRKEEQEGKRFWRRDSRPEIFGDFRNGARPGSV
jgi:hypothetical protein